MDKITLSKVELLLFVFLTMMISGASSIASNDVIRTGLFGGLLIYAQKYRKPLMNRSLAFILLGWLILNVFASLFLDADIQYYSFLGKTILVYLAYLFLSCVGSDFWRKYEYFLYRMVVISFVFYATLQIFPSLFDQIAPLFEPFTTDFFYLKSSQKNYFYAFFFVYNNGIDLIRNNGFMWEPGAYAMLLIILIAYNIATHGARINKHVVIYIIALITTFSTAGYLAVSIISFLFVLKLKNFAAKIIMFVGGIAVLFWLMDVEFLLPKIEKFIKATENNELSHQGYREMYEANRLLSINLLYDKFLQYPLGWGVVQDHSSFLAENKIVTVSGLGNILVRWGGGFFVWFLYSLGLLFYRHSGSIQMAILICLALSVMFLSNPVEDNIIFYLLVLSPYVYPVVKKK